MQEQNLKHVLERLGLRQSELARLVDVSQRSVSLWATGETPLPGPVAAYLRVLLLLPAHALAVELRRLGERNKMLDEGIYGLNYKGENMGELDGESALAVLRNGKILGSDRNGGVFMGSYEYDPKRELNKVHVRMQVPPDGVLVTGYSAGPDGAVLDIVGAFERASPVATTVVEVAGRPVEVQLTYLSPLPN